MTCWRLFPGCSNAVIVMRRNQGTSHRLIVRHRLPCLDDLRFRPGDREESDLRHRPCRRARPMRPREALPPRHGECREMTSSTFSGSTSSPSSPPFGQTPLPEAFHNVGFGGERAIRSHSTQGSSNGLWSVSRRASAAYVAARSRSVLPSRWNPSSSTARAFRVY